MQTGCQMPLLWSRDPEGDAIIISVSTDCVTFSIVTLNKQIKDYLYILQIYAAPHTKNSFKGTIWSHSGFGMPVALQQLRLLYVSLSWEVNRKN